MAVEQKKGDIKYLTPLNIDTSKQKKYCRFKNQVLNTLITKTLTSS